MVRTYLRLSLAATTVFAAGELDHDRKELFVDSLCGSRPIIFVKTHKTGSSTVATLLHRFSDFHQSVRRPCFVPPLGLDAHRWEFENDVFDRALARAQAWHIGLAASAAAAAQPTVSNARTTNDTGGAPRPSALDMWSSHGPYSPFMHTLVPGRDVLVLSIVRNPVLRWLSAFNFYDLPKRRGYTLVNAPLGAVDSSNEQWWSPPRIKSNHSSSSSSNSSELPPKLLSAVEVAIELIADAWLASNQGQELHLADPPGTPSPWAFNGMSTELGGADLFHVEGEREGRNAGDQGSTSGTASGSASFNRSRGVQSASSNHTESQSALHGAAVRLLADRIAAGHWSITRRPHHFERSNSGNGGNSGSSSSTSTRSGNGEVCRCQKDESSSSSTSGTNARGSELVMVLERFDESLVALKHFLGIHAANNHPSWPHSLLYSRGGVNRGSKPPLKLPPPAMAQLTALTTYDSWVYDAARARLDRVLVCLNAQPGEGRKKEDGDTSDRKEFNHSNSSSCTSGSGSSHGLCECPCTSSAVDSASSSPMDTGSSNQTSEVDGLVALELAALSLAMNHAREACDAHFRAQSSSGLGHDAEDNINAGMEVEASLALVWTPTACKDLSLSDYEWHHRANAALLPGSAEAVKRQAEAEIRKGLAPAEARCYLTISVSSPTNEGHSITCSKESNCATLQAKKQIHFPCALAEYSSAGPDHEAVPLGRHPPANQNADSASKVVNGFTLHMAPSLNAAPRDSCPGHGIEQSQGSVPTEVEESHLYESSRDTTADSDELHEAANKPAELDNNEEWAALVLRGGCSFRAKAWRAQDRGAAAVLLVDQAPSSSSSQSPSLLSQELLQVAAEPPPMAKELAAWLMAAPAMESNIYDISYSEEIASLFGPRLRAAWAETPSVPSLGALTSSGGFDDIGSRWSGGRVRVPVVMLTQAVGEALIELLRIGAVVEVHIEVK